MSSKKTNNKKLANEIDKMSFEDLMTRLEQITEELSSQSINLEKMISLYEEGEMVKDKCLSILENIKMKFEKVSIKNDK